MDPLKVYRNINKTATVQNLEEIGTFRKSTVRIGLKQNFRHQNLHIGHVRTDSTRSKGVQALKKHVYICHIKGCYKNYSVFTKQSTTANKLRYKGVSKLIMSPYVVNQGNTMLTYIFGNHFYYCTRITSSFIFIFFIPSWSYPYLWPSLL